MGIRMAGWLLRSFLAERDRWALWLAPAFGCGIGLYFLLGSEPNLYFVLGLGGAGIICATVAALSPEAGWRVSLSLIGCLLVGFAIAKIRTETVATPVVWHRTGPVAIEGRVEIAEPHGKGTRLTLTDLTIARRSPAETPKRIRISVRYSAGDVEPGQRVSIRAVLMPPPAPAAPGDYDFGRWAFFRQIGAVGYAYGRPKVLDSAHVSGWRDSVSIWQQGLRTQITDRILETLPGEGGAISAALITGERGAISDDDQDAFRDSGLAHVLSISGLHLALAGGIFFWVVRALLAAIPFIALRYPIKKWAAVAALIGAGLYYLISGGGAPAQRSFIMLALMFTAILFDRPALTMRNVAFAIAVILLLAPESVIEPGFQMSFGAVIGLIALAEWEETRRMNDPNLLPLTWFGRLRRYAWGIVTASLVAGLATAPFAIYHFDRASQYGVIANLAAMPIVGVIIMPAATAAMVAMPFGLDHWPLWLMGKGVSAMLWVAHAVSALPGATTLVPAWPVTAVILIAFGGLWIAFWRYRWRWLGAISIAAGLMFVGFGERPDILVSRDASTVAVRTRDGSLAFLREPSDDFAAESWLTRDGDSRLPAEAIAKTGGDISCDAMGCVARNVKGRTLAFVFRAEALEEDCTSADIVISTIPTRKRCRGPKLVIDRFDVARNGAYAITLGETIAVETAQAARGERPWSANPKRRRFNNGE